MPRLNDPPETVISLYSDMVYRLAFARAGNSTDADEIYQEVFFRYLKKKPVFKEEEHRKAWLLRVTVNCSAKLCGSYWRKKVVTLTEDFHFETKEDTDLYNELQTLPEIYREVIHLFYYEDIPVDEIARLLGRKNSTVRTQLTRGRRLLKNLLEEDDYV